MVQMSNVVGFHVHDMVGRDQRHAMRVQTPVPGMLQENNEFDGISVSAVSCINYTLVLMNAVRVP